MKSSSIKRSNLSEEGLNVLRRLTGKTKDMEDNNNKHSHNDKALDVLWKETKMPIQTQGKPMVYFFVGLIVGVVITLFLTAVVWVSDKETTDTTITPPVKESVKEPETPDTGIVTETSTGTSRTYVVKEGDTLAGIIVKMYGSYDVNKMEQIKELNGMKSLDSLKIGQELVIPD